jgi:hypothetical protein
MKTIIFLLVILITGINAAAQNVGIGTPTPFAKLEISSGSAFKPSLSIRDSSAFAGWIQMSQIGSGRNLNLFGYRSTDGNSASQYLDIATDSVSVLTLRGSGNVGVNKDQPTEKLHVRGNINVENGTIKANGVAGQPGQILSTNNSGQLQWTDKSEYKNFKVFTVPGSTTWNVPATGVSKILIEGWGAGGGGNSYAGGGGGGYFIVQWNVNPGETVIVNIGAGGTGQTFSTPGSDGALTSVLLFAGSGTFHPVLALGGIGAYVNSTLPNTYESGTGGNYSISPSIITNVKGFSGNTGLLSQIEYIKGPSDQLLYIQKDGRGGDGAESPNSGGNPLYAVFNTVTNQYIYKGGNNNRALNSGGGGGAGAAIGSNPAFLIQGGDGANGKVIIYY